jgi:biopolymer transport protein ExbD
MRTSLLPALLLLALLACSGTSGSAPQESAPPPAPATAPASPAPVASGRASDATGLDRESELPGASSSAGAAREIDPGRRSVIVGLGRDGAILVNGHAVELEDLDRIFQAAFNEDRHTQVVIKADPGIPHGRVVDVIERAKQVGLTHLAIATKSTAPTQVPGWQDAGPPGPADPDR